MVWSTVGYPTLYIAHTEDIKNCTCSASSYNDSFPSEDSVKIPGLKSDFSLAIILKKIIEFDATANSYTVEHFNFTAACNDNDTDDDLNYNFLALNDENINWTFSAESATFNGRSFDEHNISMLFSIRVSYVYPSKYTTSKQNKFTIYLEGSCDLILYHDHV